MPTLRLLCINDVYSLEQLPRLRTLVEELTPREPGDRLITTLAGDFLAPSTLSSLDFGRGMVDCMNGIPIDVVTFGNHEDDVPLPELRKRVTELRAVWLATNVPGFSPKLPRHLIIEVGRVRVGLVGVVMSDDTVYRGAPFGAPSVLPANASALEEAARLIEGGCACVIPLTHQPIDDDRALARATSVREIPVIVGGHDHSVFLEEIGGVTVVKAGADAVHAAIVELVWPASAPLDGPDVPQISVRIEDMSRHAEDAALRARVDGHMRAVNELAGATLRRVSLDAPLSSVGARRQQTTMGTMICSQVREALEAEGAVFNAGGIRGARDYPERFTYGDLKTEVPFENEVVVVRLPGRVLREAIAASRAHAPEESGGFLQVDDEMVLEGQALVRIHGEPLVEDRDYRIGIVRNLLTGLDGIAPLIRFAEAHPERVPPVGSGREIKQLLLHSLAISLWRQLGDFDALDANHDGTIDACELSVAVARFLAEPASPLTVDLVMRELDRNRDAVISRDEDAASRGSEIPPR